MNEITTEESGNKQAAVTIALSILAAILLGFIAFLLVSLLNNKTTVEPITLEKSQRKKIFIKPRCP